MIFYVSYRFNVVVVCIRQSTFLIPFSPLIAGSVFDVLLVYLCWIGRFAITAATAAGTATG